MQQWQHSLKQRGFAALLTEAAAAAAQRRRLVQGHGQDSMCVLAMQPLVQAAYHKA